MSTKVYEAAKGKTNNNVRVKAKALLNKDDLVDEVVIIAICLIIVKLFLYLRFTELLTVHHHSREDVDFRCRRRRRRPRQA